MRIRHEEDEAGMKAISRHRRKVVHEGPAPTQVTEGRLSESAGIIGRDSLTYAGVAAFSRTHLKGLLKISPDPIEANPKPSYSLPTREPQ